MLQAILKMGVPAIWDAGRPSGRRCVGPPRGAGNRRKKDFSISLKASESSGRYRAAMATPQSTAATPHGYADARSALRKPVSVAGRLASSATGKMTVTITDISETGCQVGRSARLIEGSFIMLVLPDFAPIGARVVWTGPTSIGLKFERTLHRSIVDHIVAMGGGR